MYDAFAAVDNNSASDGSEGTGDELQGLGQDKLHRPSHTRNLKSHLKESSAVSVSYTHLTLPTKVNV